MNDSRASIVQFVGVQLALVSAGIHLWWGVPRLLVYLPIGSFADPRPYLFVLSGIAIFAGAVVLYFGGPPRVLYALGTGVMLAYVFGYAAWHLTGHGGFLPGVTGYGHAENPLRVVWSHLADDPLAMAAMTVELGAAVCFTLLTYHETTRRAMAGPSTTET